MCIHAFLFFSVFNLLLHFIIYSKEVWATFPRQEEAFRFAKTHERVHLFCYQDHLNGLRRFLVCTHEEFWQRLSITVVYIQIFSFVMIWSLQVVIDITVHYLFPDIILGMKRWTPKSGIIMKSFKR